MYIRHMNIKIECNRNKGIPAKQMYKSNNYKNRL